MEPLPQKEITTVCVMKVKAMNRPTTKLKRAVKMAICHPGTSYRFKKILRDPPHLHQQSMLFWGRAWANETTVFVELSVNSYELVTDSRTIEELYVGGKRYQDATFILWWASLLDQLRTALTARDSVA